MLIFALVCAGLVYYVAGVIVAYLFADGASLDNLLDTLIYHAVIFF